MGLTQAHDFGASTQPTLHGLRDEFTLQGLRSELTLQGLHAQLARQRLQASPRCEGSTTSSVYNCIETSSRCKGFEHKLAMHGRTHSPRGNGF